VTGSGVDRGFYGMKSIYLAPLAAALLNASATAEAADFIFTFDSDLSDPDVGGSAVAGTVTGRLLGLPDDGTQGAVQVYIDSYSPDATLTYPVDVTDWFWQTANLFTVSGGMIVAAEFEADDFLGENRLFINLPIFDSGGTNYASLGSGNTVSVWNNQGLGGVTFTRIGAVPEPSIWAMMLIGFGAVGFAMRRARAVRTGAAHLA
jgi:hypothetical protein